MERGYESSKLEKLSENMNRTVIKATEGYQKLIQKFPRSSALYRFYAHFSRYVLGDEEEADTVSEQARILEVARQEAIAASKKKGAQAAPPKPLVNPRPLLEMTMTTVRAKESNRIRTKLLARNAWDIKLLFIATTVIGLISFGILIVSHLIIGGMVTTTEKGIYDLAKIHDRNLKSTMALKRCRDMQAAYVANDYATFTSIQEKLFDEMRTLQAITRQLYASRDTSNALTQQLYTQPVVHYLMLDQRQLLCIYYFHNTYCHCSLSVPVLVGLLKQRHGTWRSHFSIICFSDCK
ncbi:hypothetical protein EDD86DRAFT_59614 [Gorgonomyces haynaldii]|nr:hypothetical protein EDD86DRAFT_59614 [Gorgonomyces haynaldii]